LILEIIDEKNDNFHLKLLLHLHKLVYTNEFLPLDKVIKFD
jgi:hypothetical protein